MSSNVYFTSDLHFGHRTAAKWRGFNGDIELMDECLIANWNAVVPTGGTVYVLGDFSFYASESKNEELVARLAGQIHLVAGNHDDDILKVPGFASVRDLRYVAVTLPDGRRQKAMLCHYPMISWRSSHYGTWMLHGHCHGSLDESRLPEAKRLDVGVDTHHLRPYTLAEIAAILDPLRYEQVDHHAPASHTEGGGAGTPA